MGGKVDGAERAARVWTGVAWGFVLGPVAMFVVFRSFAGGSGGPEGMEGNGFGAIVLIGAVVFGLIAGPILGASVGLLWRR